MGHYKKKWIYCQIGKRELKMKTLVRIIQKASNFFEIATLFFSSNITSVKYES